MTVASVRAVRWVGPGRIDGNAMLLLIAAATIFSAETIDGYAVVDKIAVYALLGLIWTRSRPAESHSDRQADRSSMFTVHRLLLVAFAAYGFFEALRGTAVLADVRVLFYVAMFGAIGVVAWLSRGEPVDPDRAARWIASSAAIYFTLYVIVGLVVEWFLGLGRFDLQGWTWSGTTVAVFPAYLGLPALAALPKHLPRDRWLFWVGLLLAELVAFYYQSRSLSIALILFFIVGAYWIGIRRALLGAATFLAFVVLFPWQDPKPLTPDRLWENDIPAAVEQFKRPALIAQRFDDLREGLVGDEFTLLRDQILAALTRGRAAPTSATAPAPGATGGLAAVTNSPGVFAESPLPAAQTAGPTPAATLSQPPPAQNPLETPAVVAIEQPVVSEPPHDIDRVIALQAAWCTTNTGDPARLLFGSGYWTYRYEMVGCIQKVAAERRYHFPTTYNTIVRTATFNGMLVDLGLVGMLMLGGLFFLTALGIVRSRTGPVLVSLTSLGLILLSLFTSQNFGLLLLYFAVMPGGALLLLHPRRTLLATAQLAEDGRARPREYRVHASPARYPLLSRLREARWGATARGIARLPARYSVLFRTRPRWMSERLLVLFFFSGFASLTYQVAWQRVLTQVVGVDAYSTALIVSVFMLGLGLGGLAASRLVSRTLDVMLVYGVVEVLLGAFGFFSVPIIRGLNALLAPVTPDFAVEFAANFALLVLPTLLMGLTLPLMIHLVRHRYPPGAALGAMYSANIAGAAIGALVSGFVLVGTIGLSATCAVTAAVNVAVAVFMFRLSRPTRNSDPGRQPERVASASAAAHAPWLILAASLVAGFVALGYEIVFFRIFTAYFGMISYVFPLLLFAYLTALAIGNAAFGLAADRRRPSVLALIAATGAVVSTLVVLLGPLLMLKLGVNQERLELERYPTSDEPMHIALIVFVSLLLMSPIAFLSGLFPVLVRAATTDRDVLGRTTGLIYFTETMGNTAGVLITALGLLPVIGTVWSLRALGVAVFSVPLAIALARRAPIRRPQIGAAALISAAAIVAYPGGFYNTVGDYYDAYRFGLPAPLTPAIVKEDALGATLAYPIPGGYWISMGRERTTPLVSRAGAWEIWPLELVAAVKPRASRALVVGLGPGVHLPALERLYPGIAIDVVELDPALIDLSRAYSEPTIRQGLERANVFATDGRRFVIKHPEIKYDIIQIGPGNASTSGVGNLFSREFFTVLRDRLTGDGVVTFNGYTAGVRAALDVFGNVAVAIPGDPALAARAAASVAAEGSGARVSHVIAWNANDPVAFRDRLTNDVRYPSVIPIAPDGPPVAVRPNWPGGCLLFNADVRAVLGPVATATDDLPATEYFLTQRQNVIGVEGSRTASGGVGLQ